LLFGIGEGLECLLDIVGRLRSAGRNLAGLAESFGDLLGKAGELGLGEREAVESVAVARV